MKRSQKDNHRKVWQYNWKKEIIRYCWKKKDLKTTWTSSSNTNKIGPSRNNEKKFYTQVVGEYTNQQPDEKETKQFSSKIVKWKGLQRTWKKLRRPWRWSRATDPLGTLKKEYSQQL